MKPNQIHIDDRIIARYTDQPTALPAELRARIEHAWGGEPVELYALADLDAAMCEAGFIFDVSAVLEIEEEVELRNWLVRTHQGARRFQTRLDDWPRKLPDGGLLIRDVTGDFYRVSDPAQLDRTSRALLWAFVD